MRAPSYLLISSLVLGLAACKSGNAPSPTSSPDASPTPTPTASPTPSPSSSPSPSPSASPSPSPTASPSGAKVFLIEPGPSEEITSAMLTAIVQARPGDTIEFGCGYFDLAAGLQFIGTENITIKGCGKNKTVLSFRNSNNIEGILSTNVRGLTVEGLTVLDAKGNGFELRGTKFAVLRDVRAIWSSGYGTSDEEAITADNYAEKLNVACTLPTREDPRRTASGDIGAPKSPDYTVSTASGRYGIYPVNSENVLIDNSESIGASDAGIYVGQTKKAIIRSSRTAFNVFGFEIENVQGGMYEDNIAECNTAGFLVYDLDGLTFHGKRTIVRRNLARNNNTYNFAVPGSIVAAVPRGSGFITLAYDAIDIYDNQFVDHDTASIILTSYELLGGSPDKRQDGYSEGVHIFDNVFVNSGNNLQTPDFDRLAETEGDDVASVLPMLVGMKVAAGKRDPSQYRGAHIVWDGYIDPLSNCPYPTDADGNDIPMDENGKPESGNQYPNPACTYNAYKFDADGNRIVPKWWFSCVDWQTNTFASDSETYANFHGTKGLDSALAVTGGDFAALANVASEVPDFPATFDQSENDCPTRFGSNLPLLEAVVLDEYEPASGAAQLSPEEVAALCGATVPAGEINRGALIANCPTLQDYKLFVDPTDPRSAPNGDGVPFVLNTKLFSDHSVKYRVAYLPPGQPAKYRAIKNGASDPRSGDGIDATMDFPVGTVIAKTFAFRDEAADTERVVETRLLIKRQNSDTSVYWDGLPYIWGDDGIARLALEGGSTAVGWNYTDVDTQENYTGSTNSYVIPHQNQCAACHFNLNLDLGSAPIGPKARNMNRPYRSESSWPSDQAEHAVKGQNQLKYWCENGLLTDCPADFQVDPNSQIAAAAPRNPKFNVPGDSGHAANSPEDIEARARSYLEVNCQHCHNPKGFAVNTGFYLDVVRAVDSTYGICKRPTAAGSEGRGGRTYDIVPGHSADSVLSYRIGPEATVPAAKMPPLARSVVDETGYALIEQWINTVITVDPQAYPGSDQCN